LEGQPPICSSDDAHQAGVTNLKRTAICPIKTASEIDTVVMGHVIQAGSKMNPARQAMIAAGISVSVPALTVNRAIALAYSDRASSRWIAVYQR
jgi:acetyl-CoA acetyltransferase